MRSESFKTHRDASNVCIVGEKIKERNVKKNEPDYYWCGVMAAVAETACI